MTSGKIKVKILKEQEEHTWDMVGIKVTNALDMVGMFRNSFLSNALDMVDRNA